jgi:uncharacterized protein YuzE
MRRLAVTYDPVADAVWIKLRRGTYAETRELDSRRLLDVASDGTVLSVELLDVSDGVDVAGLPAADDITTALERHGIRVLQPAPPS